MAPTGPASIESTGGVMAPFGVIIAFWLGFTAIGLAFLALARVSQLRKEFEELRKRVPAVPPFL